MGKHSPDSLTDVGAILDQAGVQTLEDLSMATTTETRRNQNPDVARQQEEEHANDAVPQEEHSEAPQREDHIASLLMAFDVGLQYINSLPEGKKRFALKKMANGFVHKSKVEGVDSIEKVKTLLKHGHFLQRYAMEDGQYCVELRVPQGMKAYTSWVQIRDLGEQGLAEEIRLYWNELKKTYFLLCPNVEPMETHKISVIVHGRNGVQKWFPGPNRFGKPYRVRSKEEQWVHLSVQKYDGSPESSDEAAA